MKTSTLLSGAAVAASLFLSAQAARADITIGLIAPLTGPVAAYGDQVKNGAQTAVDVTNKSGGVLGQKYEDQIENYSIISGTPKTVLPKIRHVLEYIRPGSIFFWDGDGAMTHDDAMRSLRLMGEEIIPAVREMAEELDLPGPFEVDPSTGKRITAEQPAPAPAGD